MPSGTYNLFGYDLDPLAKLIGLDTAPAQPQPRRRVAVRTAPQRSTLDQLGDAYKDATQRSFVGAAVRKVAALTGLYQRDGESDADYSARIAQAERERRAQYAERSKNDSLVNTLPAAVVGGVDPTYLIAPGASLLTRVAAQGGVQGVSSLARQGVEKAQGVRKEDISLGEAALEGAAGSAFAGAAHGLGIAAKRAAPSIREALGTTGRRGATAEPLAAVQSPAHYVDRLSREGSDFLNSPEANAYYIRNAPAIKAELDARTQGPLSQEAADLIDRRAANSEAFYKGEERRQQPATGTVDPDTGRLRVNIEGAVDAPPVTDPRSFGRAAPISDAPPPPGTPGLNGVEGVDQRLMVGNRAEDVTLRDNEGLKALLEARGVDPEAVAPMLSHDPVTPTGEPVAPPAAANDGRSPLDPVLSPDAFDAVTPAGEPPVNPLRNNDNLALRDPTSPDFVASVNTERLGLPEEQAATARTAAADAGVGAEFRSREDTRAAGDRLLDDAGGPTGDAPLPTVGDISATLAAGDKRVVEHTDNLFEKIGAFGEDSPEGARALEDWVNAFGPHSQNVGETARGLNILKRDRLDSEGKAIGDPEAEKIVRDNLADPETRAAAVAAIKAAQGTPNQLRAVAAKLKKTGFGDLVGNIYYSAWLSDPASQGRNIFGNSEKILSDILIHGMAAAAGSPFKLTGSANRVFGREVAAQAYGAMRGALNAFKQVQRLNAKGAPTGDTYSGFGEAYRRGAPLDQVGREGSVGVGGKVGKVLQYGPRTMSAVDEVFRQSAFMSDLYRQATRKAIIAAGEEGSTKFGGLFADIDKIVANPDKDAVKSAAEYALEARFQNKLKGIGGIVPAGIERTLATEAGEFAGSKAAKKAARLILFPFNRTPANLLREAARTSPLGIASSRNWADWRAGGPRAQVAAARLAFGTGVTALVLSNVSNGTFTGNGPSDYRKLQALEGTGWKPNSLHVGNTYIPYEGLGPVSIMLSGLATSAERYQAAEIDGKEFGGKTAAATLGIADAAIHNGWTGGLADLFDALGKKTDDERVKGVTDMITGQVASPLSPGIARGINQSFFDPYSRETKGKNQSGFDGSIERLGNRIKTVYPGVSDSLPIRHDSEGDPVYNRRKAGGILALISPSVPVEGKGNDPVASELGRLEQGLGKKPLVPAVPTTLNIPGLGATKLSGPDYQTYQNLTGLFLKNTVADLQKAQGWDKLPDDDKRALVSQAFTEAKKSAKDEFLNGLPGLDKTTTAPAAVEAPSVIPKAAAATRQPEEDAPFTPENTFVGRPTSIRRTVKGNAKVGGVANSDHLRGDAVDFVPPAGMTVRQLYGEAKKFFPEGTYIKYEGDSIHVRIPGFNGPLFGKNGTVR